jgi:hypothetical protein
VRRSLRLDRSDEDAPCNALGLICLGAQQPGDRERRDLGPRQGKDALQWTFIATKAVEHVIAPTRGKIVPDQFLGGARPNVWVSNRLAAQGNHADAH